MRHKPGCLVGAGLRPGLHWRPAVGLVLALLLGLLASVPPGLGAKDKDQEPTRTVMGVVLDEADNPIAGATVVLKDLSNGKATASYTREDGRYQFTDLKLTRDYEVQATHKGVSSRLRRVSVIDPRKRIVFDLQIPPPKEE